MREIDLQKLVEAFEEECGKVPTFIPDFRFLDGLEDEVPEEDEE